MPAKPNRHARNSKSHNQSPQPRSPISPVPDLLVDLEPQDPHVPLLAVNHELEEEEGEFKAPGHTRSEIHYILLPRAVMASMHNLHGLQSQLQTLLDALSDFTALRSDSPPPSDAFRALIFEDPTETPIPIPVPRSQTPLSSSASPFPPSAHVPSSFLHHRAPSPSPSPPPSRSRPPAHPRPSAVKRFPAPAPFTRLDRAPAAAVVDLGTSRVEPASSANPPLPHVHQTGPRSDAYPEIRWSRWDNVFGHKVLFVGHTKPAALAVWQISRTGKAVEVLRKGIGAFGSPESSEATIVHAAVLAPPRGDVWAAERPLIGVAIDLGTLKSGELGTFVVYSLRTQCIVHRVIAPGRIVDFEASAEYVVLSTHTPPQLHVLSAHSLSPLHVFPSTRLAPYNTTITPSLAQANTGHGLALLSTAFAGLAAYTQPSHPANPTAPTTPTGGYNYGYGRRYDSEEEFGSLHLHPHRPQGQPHRDVPPPAEVHPPAPPRPVYALSRRLLAFASPTTAPEGTRNGNGATSGRVMATGLAAGMGLPTTQAELGSAALRVGGSVWGGMRTLGGLAVSAARSRVASGSSGLKGVVAGGGSGEVGQGVGRFFSRSAPEGAVIGGWGGTDVGASDVHGSGNGTPSEGGYSVTVVDLARMPPLIIAEFMVTREKQISRLVFSGDGCAIVSVMRDGHTAQVFQLRGARESTIDSRTETPPPWHLYNLRRGRTSAVVDGVECAHDGRWVALGTRKRTVHVFAVNPYGGKGDNRSHVEGRVRNSDEQPTLPTDITPIVRLRGASEHPLSPLSFTFLPSSEYTLPTHLLPHAPPPAPRSVASDASSSPPISPGHLRRRTTNFQDLLLFDPADATISLRRLTLEVHPKEQGLASAALGATSISLPGMGPAGRLSGSPGTGFGHGRSRSKGRSGVAQALETSMEMIAQDTTVMTWDLRRRWDSDVVGVPLEGMDFGGADETRTGTTNWLSQAEISTCSRSLKVLPRPIYLSHQFSFHTLGEDYHALIRGYQLNICGEKIEVRKEVQVSAYSAGSGEAFVEGFSAPRDMRHRTMSSSFDEPLASALAGALDHPHTGILPMLPNGAPSSRPQSFRTSIPIRAMTGIGDGMSESLGRIRRELNKARSPRLKPRPDSSMSASVPLEFDEEDEDFVNRNTLEIPDGDGRSASRDTSRGDGSSGPTVSTPATSTHPLDEDEDDGLAKVDDAWGGWSSEDKLAVDEVERFDNIDVLGLLDEEQTPALPQKRKGRTRRRDI